MKSIDIGAHAVGTGRTFIIAEVGSNHTGNLTLAKEHIEAEININLPAFIPEIYIKNTSQRLLFYKTSRRHTLSKG